MTAKLLKHANRPCVTAGRIAAMVLFLSSAYASFAVGQAFVIDGGYTTH
jgi:NAD(P)-dependent dehydrogenase (short-subunit alcohol dehydrogenase family)